MSEANSSSSNSAHDPNSKEKPVIVIVRKVKKVHGGHHGGSWKIAYADFVTAMMTFFMLMWLLSMLNKAQLEGISEYFKNPNNKSDQQAIETKDKTKDALAAKESSGMASNINVDKNKNKDNDKNKEKEKEKKKQDSKMMITADQIKKDLEKSINQNPILSQYKSALNIKVTNQGLKIELKDLKDKPMFSNGKTDFADYAKVILDWLAPTLNKYPNRVMVVGHTDSKPLNRKDYTNWELSTDRASSTRRTLVDYGMDDRKIVRVVGVGDTDKLEKTQPDDPANRRIVLIVLTDEAYKAMQDQ